MSISNWFTTSHRTGTGYSFEVTDLEETPHVPSNSELVTLLRNSYFGNDRLARIAARYGKNAVRDIFLAPRSDAKKNVRRGDFGEAVTAEYLKDVAGYQVPISKLRYKISANQTLPGADCVAVKVSDGNLVEVAYVESKLRTSYDSSVAVDGALQLKKDADNTAPEILTFIVSRLDDLNHPLHSAFLDYLFHRGSNTHEDTDRFLLFIVHERQIWNEGILRNLKDAEIEIEPMRLYVARITGLRNLADSAFSSLGMVAVSDGD